MKPEPNASPSYPASATDAIDAKRVVVAVDVGGTSIKCALMNPDGTVRHSERHPTYRDRGPVAVLETILSTAQHLVSRAHGNALRPVAVGVAVPGVVDEAAGMVTWSANLGLYEVPLRDLLAARLALPVTLGHDVRAGALAEARLGAGRATRRMLFVAIGTGVASGYACDGVVDPGANGAAGEMGHIPVRGGADAPECACGGRGCLEVLVSGAAVARAYQARAANGVTVTAAQVAARAANGDPHAEAVWTQATAALVDGLLTAIALYNPELVVLGGGLAEAGEQLLDPVRSGLTRRRTFHHLPTLAHAALGDQSGCLGAGLLAWDRAWAAQ